MKATSTLRGPYRPRSVVPAVASQSISDAGLRRAVVAVHVVILALCAARVAADWSQGPLGGEGGLALVLFGLFGVSLAARGIRWAHRGSRGAPEYRAAVRQDVRHDSL